MVSFEEITAEFSPEFDGLKDPPGNLRDVLFQIRGSLFTGTYKDRNIKYDSIINAFPKIVCQLERDRQINI
jgi:hypothetical protein